MVRYQPSLPRTPRHYQGGPVHSLGQAQTSPVFEGAAFGLAMIPLALVTVAGFRLGYVDKKPLASVLGYVVGGMGALSTLAVLLGVTHAVTLPKM